MESSVRRMICQSYSRILMILNSCSNNTQSHSSISIEAQRETCTDVIEMLTKHIKDPDCRSSINVPRIEYLINSHKAYYERTQVLTSSILEHKASLRTFGQDFSVDGELNLENNYIITNHMTAFSQPISNGKSSSFSLISTAHPCVRLSQLIEDG